MRVVASKNVGTSHPGHHAEADAKKTKGDVSMRPTKCIAATVLLATLTLPVGLAAKSKEKHKPHHHHYKLIDLRTFGGPQSWVMGGFEGSAATLSNAGTVAGTANTPDSNPNYNYGCQPANTFASFTCNVFGTPDPFVEHAFQFKNGVLVDLGVLPGGYNSYVQWVSTNGLIAGDSENGLIDPLAGVPEARGVLWQNGEPPIDLGTFGGGQSAAFAVNGRGQVVGFASNTIADPFDGFGTQIRAYLWQNGVKQDLGTLGTGTDAMATLVNEHGQVAGVSFTSTAINPRTGSPNIDPFFWENGKIQDIGTFGGGIGAPFQINNRGQVVGQEDLPPGGTGQAQAFLWKNGVLTHLGTLPGGISSRALWINDAGEIVGFSGIQNDQFLHAVLWNPEIVDLGTLDGDPCSWAQSINLSGQIVGGTLDCSTGVSLHAFLWENGGPMVDLNTLIPPGSNLQLNQVGSINDRGEITGEAITSNGDNHGFLLIPCDDKHAGVEGCDYSLVDTPVAVHQASSVVRNLSSHPLPQSLMRRMNRYHFPGLAFGPRN
jgi:probable HAF family extracellular repeat protein